MRQLTDVEQQLVPFVANIARNPVRQQRSSTTLFSIPENCEVCTTPVQGGYPLCWQCNDHRRLYGSELADLVVPVSYGVKGLDTLGDNLGQYYHDLFSYKWPVPPSRSRQRLTIMAYLFAQLHLACLERQMAADVNFVTSVPSGQGRPGPHPLDGLRAYISRPVAEASHVGPIRHGRAKEMDPGVFSFAHALYGHVLVFEDSWVAGHNAQSLAVAARRSGADRVSIVVLGRVLDMSWAPSARWVQEHLPEQHWTPTVCPVSGQPC